MHSIITLCNKEIRISGRAIKSARLEGDGYEFAERPEALMEELRSCGRKVDLFTFTQRLPETSPKYNYPYEWDNYAVLRVTTFDRWWNEQIGFKARNKARQAEKKGVVIREVPFGNSFAKMVHQVYNEAPMRQGRPNSHYGKDVGEMYRMLATFPDSSIFLGAFLGDTLIGFAKLVQDETGTQAGLMHIFSMLSHRDKAPTNALVAQAVRTCAERGISYLVYANFIYGQKQHSTLIDFKERNGFERLDTPRYYVPLTAVGRLALCLGLHRKLIEYIPESFGEKLREYRAAWYARRFQAYRNARDLKP